jgi:hypothetical protein
MHPEALGCTQKHPEAPSGNQELLARGRTMVAAK